MLRSPRLAQDQCQVAGYALVESLVALLIFCVGILGLIALQSNLYAQTLEARLRAQASILASGLIGLVVADQANASCYVIPTPGACASTFAPAYVANFVSNVQTTLPNGTVTSTLSVNNQYTVTIGWKRAKGSLHGYTITTQLGA